MPEGEISLTGDQRVNAALLRIRGKFRDLEEAIIVQGQLEKTQAERTRAHTEAIDRHELWMIRFQEKLDALTDMITRREGGPETK